MNLNSKNHMLMKWVNTIQYRINVLKNAAVMPKRS